MQLVGYHGQASLQKYLIFRNSQSRTCVGWTPFLLQNKQVSEHWRTKNEKMTKVLIIYYTMIIINIIHD